MELLFKPSLWLEQGYHVLLLKLIGFALDLLYSDKLQGFSCNAGKWVPVSPGVLSSSFVRKYRYTIRS